MRARQGLTLLTIGLLAACAGKRDRVTDNEPTLKTLANRTVTVQADQSPMASNPAQAIEAYGQFLAVAPKASQRALAMRRMGDLEMDRADSPEAGATADPDYRAAIARYQEFLKTYPNDPSNDRVLYQLARAQEQSGNLDGALQTLDRLVKVHPTTSHGDEAQFRRGELLFTARKYTEAEAAYATVLAVSPPSRYQDRALYMQGWSQYKQGKLEPALLSFFGVLDQKLGQPEDDAENAALTRADRELVEDTFRVTSLSLSSLNGAQSIPTYITSDKRLRYEPRIYEELGELYLKQERVKDAADTFALFGQRKPLNAQAPLLQARVIDVYARNGFATLALAAKKDYVLRYGRTSEFRTTNPKGWEQAQAPVKAHLAELAQHYHASAQKNKSTADYQEAALWYRESLASFPDDPQNAQTNFLLAELLQEDGRIPEATAEYEKTAYAYPQHPRSADAGYAALLGYAQQQKTASAIETQALAQTGISSALRFAKAFPGDARTAPVLADTAEKLYALKDSERAASVAQSILALQPPAAEPQRRVAWTIVAYTSYDAGNFGHSEAAFGEVLKLTAINAANRSELVERQAAAIYKQGEQARTAGLMREAVAHFERVSQVAPQSSANAAAQYDAAALLIGLKDWNAAARSLEDFRQRYPGHALQGEVGGKLALVYLEQKQWASAATELERLSNSNTDPVVARDALWQSAELYQKAGNRAAALKTYERYLARNPQPLEPALEARFRLAEMAREDGNTNRTLALMKDILQTDQNGGTARTARTRFLGATAALALAEPVAKAYAQVALTEPLQKQLKLKKARMEETLKAYAVATDYGVADVTTAATYRIATVYHDFSKALMASERPKKLNKLEREQYNVLLEEQAFPFEEKATEIHEANARRAATGIYDSWVQSSFDALRVLRPVRYGKTERSDNTASEVAVLNQQGIDLRKAGQFAKAREAYEQALAKDASYAPAALNLGILFDLYLCDNARALALYDRYLTLTPQGDSTVTKWVAELKNRKPALAAAASMEKA
ncbi:MAG: tetratricopeptide repeat protein [Rhodoferax sp.]|nr:tetratricopeptide repeat protein [Rhodoferax sp.]